MTMSGTFTNANPFGIGFGFGNQSQNNNVGSASVGRLVDFGAFSGNVAAPVANVTNQGTASTNNNAVQARVGGMNVQFAPAQEPGRIGRVMGDLPTLG
jgi:hypothetical protein